MGSFVGIDQGTSGTTVLVLDASLNVRSRASCPITSRHSPDGGVEQDPWEVLASIVEACGTALETTREEIETAGFAHQGETVIAWDPDSLEPLTPAIVWSDRRPEAVVKAVTDRGLAERVADLSGMRLDPYFCAAKYRWMLDAFPGVQERVERGRLRLGTFETWLLLQLGATFETDIGTASRTQLTTLGASHWDPELLEIFALSPEWLTPIGHSLTDRGGLTHPDWDVNLPLHCVMVDQPAALVGNGCLSPGEVKVTYGTGAFVMANVGRGKPDRQFSVVTSVGWGDGVGPTYVLDGGVLSVGSALTWLAGLGVDVTPEAQERIGGRGPSSITVMPAFSGLGAPRWDRNASAAISGITAHTSGEEVLQAFLDSFAFRVREIFDVMTTAGVPRPAVLRVDGGLTRSTYLMQRQADALGLPLAVAADDEATALGVAAMAGATVDVLDLGEAADVLGRSSRVIEPANITHTDEAYRHWLDQVYRDVDR